MPLKSSFGLLLLILVVSFPTYLNDSKRYIDSNYNAKVLETFKTVTVYQLNGKKHHD